MSHTIGITGPIGSGKSLLSSFFVKKGYLEIDVDLVGKEVLQLPFIKDQLKEVFSEKIFNSEGHVISSELGSLVFNHPKNLSLLNKIMHPVMIETVKTKRLQYSNQPCIINAALLFQMKLHLLCNFSITLSVEENLLIPRILKRSSYITENMARKIILQQKEANFFEKNSEIVIENNFSKKNLENQFNQLFSKIREDYHGFQ